MTGRESKKDNDLFFTCSLIEYIARKTKNEPSVISACLGKETLQKIYDLADVYHSDNIDIVTDELVREKHITEGHFDNVSACKYSVPTHWDIGKVYKRLILMAEAEEKNGIIETLLRVYQSKVSALIEDYNSSFYYDNPETVFETWRNGGVPY